MELSKRLRAVADLVTEGSAVADIGTDHAYIPIYLAEAEKSPRIIAMDVNQGPLLRAENHVAAHHLESYIETRLSDGLKELGPGEVDSVVIAGMGGGLVIKILSQSPLVVKSLKECILQPQSEVTAVREYLWQSGLKVEMEDMILEDGKFYPMMKVKHGYDKEYSIAELRYGRCLLKQKHPVLKQYLEREIKLKKQIIGQLKQQSKERSAGRLSQLQEQAALAAECLERMR